MTSTLRPFAFCCLAAVCFAEGLGQFESSADVGVTPQKGKVEFDAASGEYRVTGGGANIWAEADAFQFAWKKMSGDMAFSADIHFIGAGAVAHRKAALMIRQSLDADSAYADAALHGDGLTSLQFRPAAAAATLETNRRLSRDLTGPVRIRIERRGNNFTMLAGKPGEQLTTTGPATVALQDPSTWVLPSARTMPTYSRPPCFPMSACRPCRLRAHPSRVIAARSPSSICATNPLRLLYQAEQVFEAPNWSSDGKYLFANSGGRLYRIPVDGPAGAAPEAINIDPSLRLNNDHAPSPDGKQIAFSASSPASRQSQVYLSNADGSNVHLMVSPTPSYFHGWSPDGKYLAYVLQHPGANGAPANYDIFRVPAAGGNRSNSIPTPATTMVRTIRPTASGFTSTPTAPADGKCGAFPPTAPDPAIQKAERVTNDEMEDWFPHPSPDRKWLLFLSFAKGTTTHNDKLPGTQLRMMPMPGARLARTPQIQVVTTFFGGQGTINVNSWSPDSKRFAYVIYEPLPAAATAAR